MPFPSEHAARQVDPSKFERFARKPVECATGIDFVYGVSDDGKAVVQSVRFDSGEWTPAEAKEWLSDHGFAISGFEPALEKAFTVEIAKVVPDQHLVFGWLYVSKTANGEQVVDHSGDTIAIDELERAAYGYMLNSRTAGDMHQRVGVGRAVASMVFTPEVKAALGIPEGLVPDGWWIGFKIDDTTTWERIKSGELKMFSIGGKAIRSSLGG
jgi:hypothetical protein